MVAILRHSGGLSTKKATEVVIVGNNRRIKEWIDNKIVTGRIEKADIYIDDIFVERKVDYIGFNNKMVQNDDNMIFI